MTLRWTSQAHGDLARLHAFLEPLDPRAAVKTVDVILAGVLRIGAHPRLGTRLKEFEPEVRRIIVAGYEIRYEVRDRDLFILRIWHQRESR